MQANSNGEDDIIELGAGSYSLSLAGKQEDASATGDLDLFEAGHTITIRGAGIGDPNNASAPATIIDAKQIDRAFEVSGSAAVVLENLVVRGGRMDYSNGAGIANFGHLTLENVLITGNTLVQPDQSKRGGGGIYNQGTMRLEQSKVIGNASQGELGGGGIYSTGELIVSAASLIEGNTASFDGGGVRIAFGTMTIEHSFVRSNTATRNGGGIYIATNPVITATIRNSTIADNTATLESGGGVYNGAQLAVSGSSIAGNKVTTNFQNGGGIYNVGTLSLDTSTVRNNRATNLGGGIFSRGDTTINRSTLSHNHSDHTGGGLFNGASATTTIAGSTFSGNTARRSGAGIENDLGTLLIENTTITGNRADALTDPPGQFSLGGGLNTSNGTTRIDNTIIARNFSGKGSGAGDLHDVKGRLDSASTHNLVGIGTHGLQNGVNGNLTGITEPLLVPLSFNGGPTETHALLLDSPAVHAGNPAFTPLVDQRGLFMNDAVDIGSFELQQVSSSPFAFDIVGASQFPSVFGNDAPVFGFGIDDGSPNSPVLQKDPLFLGFAFDTGAIALGHIEEGVFGDKYGGEIRADFAGRLGLELGLYVNLGSIDISYAGALNNVIDEQSDGTIRITAVPSYGTGGLYTISPRLGGFADLVLELDASIGATACLVGCVGGDASFQVDETIELFSINRQKVDDDGNPLFFDNGAPILNGQVQYITEQLANGIALADDLQKAFQKINEGRVERDKAQRELQQAQAEQEREAARKKVDDAEKKISEGESDQKAANSKTQKKSSFGSPLTVDFGVTDGDLLGLEATLGIGASLDKVVSAKKEIGSFQVTLPDIQLRDIELDPTGQLSASTKEFKDPVQQAKRQLAQLSIDVGGLVGPLLGIPAGKYSVSLAGSLLNLAVQTVSYKIEPTLNVTQQVSATPHVTRVVYEFRDFDDMSMPRSVLADTGSGFELRDKVEFRADPNGDLAVDFAIDLDGDDPVAVVPLITMATTVQNQLGLEVDIDGALEAFALKLTVAGNKVIDAGPLITHKHDIGSPIPIATFCCDSFRVGAKQPGGQLEDNGQPVVLKDKTLQSFVIGQPRQRNGSSPLTALIGQADLANPDVSTVSADVTANVPLYVATDLINEQAATRATALEFTVANNSVRSIMVFEQGTTVESLDGSLQVEGKPLDGAAEYTLPAGMTGFRINGFTAENPEAIVRFQFADTASTTVRATRVSPVPVADVPELGVGDQSIDRENVERHTARVVLNSRSIDIDGDGVASPLSDGVLLIRYLNGTRGGDLIEGAVNTAGTRTTAAAIEQFIAENLSTILDVDSNGQITASGDGILAARHLAGFTGESLTIGAADPNGQRSDPAKIRMFLSGTEITANNAVAELEDENGNVTSHLGSGFEIDAIVDTHGGDPFALEGVLDPAADATSGSSAAKPTQVMTGTANAVRGAAPSVATEASALALNTKRTLDFELTTFGQQVAYEDLFLRDAADPADRSKWQLVSSMAAGSPMPISQINLGNLADANEVHSLSSRLIKETRSNALGIDEPLFIEVPDAAGYTYEALDGYKFRTLNINPDFGGNLYLDRQFDLYLFDDASAQWQFARTISTDDTFQFPGGVASFQLFGLSLPNQTLHRAANGRAPEIITTTGFTLEAPPDNPNPAPRIRLTQEEPRNRLETPDDVQRCDDAATCPQAFGTDGEFRVVRTGASALITFTPRNSGAVVIDTVQIASATNLTFQGDNNEDVVTIDTSGGPIRLPFMFHGGDGTDSLGSPKQDSLRIDGQGVAIDLTGRDQITGVERIDIRGDGPNSLKLDLQSVTGNTGTGQTFIVFANTDDAVEIGPGWAQIGSETIDGNPVTVFVQQGATLKVSSEVAGSSEALDNTPVPKSSAPAAVAAGVPEAPAGPDAQTAETGSQNAPVVSASASPSEVLVSEIAKVQRIMVAPANPSVAPGKTVALDVIYATTPNDRTTGLNLRMHFDSSRLNLVQLSDLLPDALSAQQVQDDGAGGGLDGDRATDKYVNLLWISSAGSWPSSTRLPARLFTAHFVTSEQFSGNTTVNFTAHTAAEYTIEASPATITPQLDDITPPELTLVGEGPTVEATGPDGALVTFALPLADDDRDPSPQVTCLPQSGGTFPLGMSEVSCYALDEAGNTNWPAARAPNDLLIYYAWPSVINGTSSLAAAAGEFGQYDYVVLGEGLEKPAHPDHQNTVDILADPAMDNTIVIGYIDLGVTTQNLSIAEIQNRVDEWQASGADGVLFDDFGYDFGVARARQNAAVTYAHSKGMSVVANGFSADDVLGSDVDPVFNPQGLPTRLGADDFYLYESHQVRLGEIVPEPEWLTRAAALREYRDQIGFQVLSVTTNDASDEFDRDAFFYAWHSAALFGHEATGWGEYLYSADDAVAPFRPRPASSSNAEPATFTVTVQDTTSPQLGGIPTDIVAESAQLSGAQVHYSLPSATDLVDADPAVTCLPASASVFPIGITTVACSAMDDAGNTDAATFRVAVPAPVAPTITNVIFVPLGNGGRATIDTVRVTFSEPMNPDTVENLTHYALRSAGRSSRTIPLSAASFDPNSFTVTLNLATALRPNGSYELLVRGAAVTDLAGNPMDGDSDNLPGGDYITVVMLGTSLSYTEPDGDLVRLHSTGLMQLDTEDGGHLKLLADQGSLTGSVRSPRRGGADEIALLRSVDPEFDNRLPDSFLIGPGQIEFQKAIYRGTEHGGDAVVTVLRTGGLAGLISVEYATADNTATAGLDYTAAAGTLRFAHGESSKTFPVPILDDFLEDFDETIHLILRNARSGATLGPQSTATLTIRDDEDPSADFKGPRVSDQPVAIRDRRNRVVAVRLSFDELLDSAAAQDTANFRLDLLGPLPQAIAFHTPQYDDRTRNVQLDLVKPLRIKPTKPLRIIVDDLLMDVSSNRLDGDGDLTPGGDYLFILG